ncbi:hypothetical protein HOF92_00070, partial [bacterium]|nr:hypothetical protein [bacterium]
MNILGLNHGEYNSSAALVIDGKLVAAAPEERFSRKKKTKEFPLESIRFCLESQGLQFHDVDCIAQAWNPTANWCKFNPLISGTRIRREDYFYSLGDNLYRLSDRTPGDWVSMNFDQETGLPTIYYVQHHRTHSALAFFQSPFDEAAILTCDWRGELESTTLGVGRGCELETLQSQWMPHSMGMFYAAYTELLGYRPHNDEWKVMAISAYDVDCSEMLSKIRQTYRLVDDGNVELDSTYYKGAILDQPGIYTEKLRDLLGGRSGVAGDEPDE